MKFMGYLFFMGILVILAGFFLFSNLNYTESPRKICADDVQFMISKQPLAPGEFCYERTGRMDFVVINQGDLNLTGMVIEIIGVKGKTKNITINDLVTPSLGKSFFLNINMADVGGDIEDVVFYPKILYDNDEHVCLGNRFTYKDVDECGF